MTKKRLAIIGSGATAIYLLKHLVDAIPILKTELAHITIFEKSSNLGMGMPYNPETTDIYNLSNISSAEIPELPDTFGDWLRRQDIETLDKLNVKNLPVDDSEVYSRIALGQYLFKQYCELLSILRKSGVEVVEKLKTEVIDIEISKKSSLASVVSSNGKYHNFSKVIVATGHTWIEKDNLKMRYYASPWPIQKLLPKQGQFYNFTIGTLGASLSAFDVVTSLAHRHGKFTRKKEGLKFQKKEEAPFFKVVMHSAEGWLPHLQYEQEYPLRVIYRHTDRLQMLSLIDADGFLRIETYFDEVCRPALTQALLKDNEDALVSALKDSKLTFKRFVALMSEKHEYTDSFAGMRKEMVAAKKSVEENRPIHWKETLDDLMYCLNFHAELLPAEDHLFVRQEVMPFLMNVIAALPLSSAEILLALEEAGCIELMAGNVKILNSDTHQQNTLIAVENGKEDNEVISYEMFINCAGQKNIDLEKYPFQSLVEDGKVRGARSKFTCNKAVERFRDEIDCKKIISMEDDTYLLTGGIDVDAVYRTIQEDGQPSEIIHDITFTHTSGCRPYSYGLQACSATGKILVDGWIEDIKRNTKFKVGIETITKIYEEDVDL